MYIYIGYLFKINALTGCLFKIRSICVFTVTCQKNLGSALILFLTIGETGNSHSRFRNPIPVFHFRNFR